MRLVALRHSRWYAAEARWFAAEEEWNADLLRLVGNNVASMSAVTVHRMSTAAMSWTLDAEAVAVAWKEAGDAGHHAAVYSRWFAEDAHWFAAQERRYAVLEARDAVHLPRDASRAAAIDHPHQHGRCFS